MPLLPRFGADLAHLRELELALLELFEGDVGGHDLGHRGGRDAAVRILRVEHRPRREIDQEGDRRGGLERRRGG